MTHKITRSPIKIATKDEVLEGNLLFVEGALVAVASHLSDSHNGEGGKWFVEAAFARLDPKPVRTFETLEQIILYIHEHYR